MDPIYDAAIDRPLGRGTEFKFFVPMLKANQSSDGKKRLHGVASSTVADRHGDVMNRTALQDMLESANRGLTIFLNHSYNVPEDVAGTVERATLKQATGDIHDLSFDILINDKNPRAVAAWDAIQNGTQLGLSIGAMIPEGGAKVDRKSGVYMIDHVDLVETSIVGVPANPRSWVEYAVKALRKTEPSATPADSEVTLDLHFDSLTDAVEFVQKGDTTLELDPIEAEVTNTEPSEVTEVTEVTEPEKTDATVTVETPLGKVTVDTGNRGSAPAAASTPASQDAPSSNPENESAASDTPPWLGVPGNPPAKTESVDPDFATVSPLIVASLRHATDLVTSLTSELVEVKSANARLTTQAIEARSERDEAIREATKVLGELDAILKRLASTPIGRKSVYHESVGRFEAIRSVYGDDFAAILARSNE